MEAGSGGITNSAWRPLAMASLMERLSQAKKFVDGVLGADKYQHYLEHQARTHPDQKPMNEREFWKDYTDWQEKNPEGRCC